MLRKLQTVLFFAIYACLWMRFFFMLWDPYWSGASIDLGLPVYRDLRFPLDWLYYISGILILPIYTVYGWIAPLVPKIQGFPGVYTASILAKMLEDSAKMPESMAIYKQFLKSPFVGQIMLGYADWLTLIGLVVYRIFDPLLEALADFIKNVVWNVLIEFSFSKRKENTYQQALGKRAADLMKLNVEYKNLSNENSVLAVSVVTDELTKAYNKRFFIEKMTFEFNNAKTKKSLLSVAMLDIDHFKKLNDQYGHLFGDIVLKAVAQVAREGTPKDCFCCRFGGEEFAIIMPGKSFEEAQEIVSAIHQKLPQLTFAEQPGLHTSASFGLCFADFRSGDAQAITGFEGLLKVADDELYRAKLNGRNRVESKALV